MKRNKKFSSTCFAVATVITLVFAALSSASAQTLAWTANQDEVNGYKVYYGTSEGNYTSSVDVGNNTQYALADLGLSAGQTYYLAVTAYNSYGESSFSTSISWTPPDVKDTTPPLPPTQLTAE